MSIWDILEISETKDKDVIKNAYRKKLQKVNPEDDPEGFMSLRHAFEEANIKADAKDTEDAAKREVPWQQAPDFFELEEMTQKQQIEYWILRVENLYKSFYDRISTEAWELLLDDAVCQQIDMADETRVAFLNFLMEHTKFPNRIWKMFERTFEIIEDGQTLKDIFPVDFIDYISNAVAFEGVIDYDLFDGAGDADYDLFMDSYFLLKYYLDLENYDEARKQLDVMEGLEIEHPYMYTEKSRLLIHDRDMDAACDLMAPLAEEFPNNDYILYFYGAALAAAGRTQEARLVFEKILVLVPEHYMAKYSLTEMLFKEGQYKAAKDAYLELIEVNEHDEIVIEQLKQVNLYLIPEYEKKIEENPADLDSVLDLGWCLCQNEQYERCLDMLETLQVDEEHLYDYTNLRGRILLCLNRFDESLPYLLQWRQMIIDTVDDGEEKTRKRIKRIGYANYAVAMCYASDKVKDYENAMFYIDKAIETEKSADQQLSCYYGKADIYKRLGKYEAAVDVCSTLLEKEKRFYPAYILRMECFVEMGYGGDVINDYYTAVNLYPEGERPYEIACELFIDANVPDRAGEVLKQAANNHAKSLTLDILKLHTERKLSKTAQELQCIINEARKLLEERAEEFKDDKQKAECYHLMSVANCDRFIMFDQDVLQFAMKDIKDALKLDPENDEYLNINAYILSKQGDTSAALKIYHQLLEKNPDNCYYLFRIAAVYGDCRDLHNSLKYYKAVAKIDPGYPDVHREIGIIYRELAEEEHQRSYIMMAIESFNKQMESGETQYDLIERGRLYLEYGLYEMAEKDIMRTLEISEDNIYAYNAMGDIYRYQRKYDKAIAWYEKGLDHAGEDNTPVLYENMAQCYECMGQYDQVACWYDKALELFPKRGRIYDKYGHFYEKMKCYDKAARIFEKGRDINAMYKKYFKMQIAAMMEKYTPKDAYKIYKEYYKQNDEDVKACLGIGRYFLYHKTKYKKSLEYYLKALKIADELKNMPLYIDACFGAGMAYFFMEKRDCANDYFHKALMKYKERYEDIFKSEKAVGMDANDFYMIGRLFALSGNLDRAQMFFDAMEDEKCVCEYCMTCVCYEYIMSKGLMAYLKGCVKEAAVYYRHALEISKNDSECLIALKMLGEKF